jgi:hypothetical protein
MFRYRRWRDEGSDEPPLLTPRGIMDPLQQLWKLYEEYVEKPQLQDAPTATMGTPADISDEHPVTQERRKVDVLRSMGMDAEDAHQRVYGDVDTGDTAQKAQLASTLARVQNDGGRKGIKVEKDTPTPSILAMVDNAETKDAVTPHDFKTPQHKEVPNAVQEEVDTEEEYDYNQDVAYLQKFGRA